MKIVFEAQLNEDTATAADYIFLLMEICQGIMAKIPPDLDFAEKYKRMEANGHLHEMFGAILLEGNKEGRIDSPMTFRIGVVNSDMLHKESVLKETGAYRTYNMPD